jgi:hypothetical protein
MTTLFFGGKKAIVRIVTGARHSLACAFKFRHKNLLKRQQTADNTIGHVGILIKGRLEEVPLR